MVSFSNFDFFIIILFFIALTLIAYFSSRNVDESYQSYFLAGRNVGLYIFVLSNVSTWYGGILGVGEFVYSHGFVTWFVQGLPYYVFALLYVLIFTKKIHFEDYTTIPERIMSRFGAHAGKISAVIILILTNPAPYLLMTANIIGYVTGIPLLPSLLISFLFSGVYILKGGLKADLYTDVLFFFIMFAGFIAAFFFLSNHYGGITFLQEHLPGSHLTITGTFSPTIILVWWLIAITTFSDPGFHQRVKSARNISVARWGIIISIGFWMLFDFLTLSAGLYTKALFNDLKNPVEAFLILGDKILPSGIKGIFFAGLLATVLSTLNSFLLLSSATLTNDLFNIHQIKENITPRKASMIATIIVGFVGIFLCLLIPSVVEMWYILGSIAIPGFIIVLIAAFFQKGKMSEKVIVFEMICGAGVSIVWFLLRYLSLLNEFYAQIEPMLIGLTVSVVIHISGMMRFNKKEPQ